MTQSSFSWNATTDIVIPGDTKTTIAFSVSHFLKIAKAAIQEKGSFFVALFGGSTPKPIYQMLSQHEESKDIDWSKVHLFWSDERSVPPTNPESNYHMAMHNGIEKLPIPEKNIHRMHAEEDIEKNALEYEKTIHRVLQNRPFDLVMLGVGDDGHTASLFPGTKALSIQDRLVAANFVPQKDTWRMTFTYPCINAAKHIVIYILGEEKKEIVKKLFTPSSGEAYPCQKVGTPTNKVCWITDAAASSLISLSLKK